MTRPPPGSLAVLADALLGLLAPPECAGCGRSGAVVCDGCLPVLTATPRRVEVPVWPGAPPATACPDYTGVVRTCVNAWKERGRHDLEPVLGLVLADAVDALPLGGSPVVLVPVPSTAAARRRRGADAVRNLALHAAPALRAAGTATRVVPALSLRHAVADQSGLTAEARVRNVRDAFGIRSRAGPLLTAGDVVVVDDVLTTGATLRSASAAVTATGVPVRGLACVSVTPRRRSLSAPTGRD